MILETERLLLRPWEVEDAKELYEAAKNPHIGPIAGWPIHTSVEHSRDIIKGVLSAKGTFAVVLKETGIPIGSVGIMVGNQSGLMIEEEEAEIGYWIAEPFWGKGYIPEALRELQRYGFMELGLKTLWCCYFDGNEKSKRVQEKCGFQYQYTIMDSYFELIKETKTLQVTCLRKAEWQTSYLK